MTEVATIGGAAGAVQSAVHLPAVIGPPTPAEWVALKEQAAVIASSGLAPKSASTPDKVLVIALKARELRLPPMVGLSHIYVVEGKPTLSAEIMAALVHRAGHRLRVVETSAERCVIEGERVDDPGHPQRVTWDMDDAKRAGVAGKGPWKNYPAAMLRARAISALCRFAFADVLMGVAFTPEELGANVDEEGAVVEEAYAVEDRISDAEVVTDDDHAACLRDIEEILAGMPEDVDSAAILEYAGRSYEHAVATERRLRTKIEEADKATLADESTEVSEPDEKTVDNATEPNERNPMRERPARKSQVELLKTLAVEWAGDGGVERLEKRIGKPLSDLTRDEADEWIARITPEDRT